MGLDDDDDHKSNSYMYEDNSTFMLTAIISLSAVVLFVSIFHFYTRFVLGRRARRRMASLSANINFIANGASQIHSVSELPKTGLDPSITASLPTFVLKQGEMESTECSVCLSLLEEGEVARTLPNCKHTFHADCIDKWFGTHSSCPLCRSEAEPPRLLIMPEPREGVAPPSDPAISTLAGVEGTASSSSSEITDSSAKIMSSFRRILSRERSSQRIQFQSCTQDNNIDGIADLERQ